ncbi:MAG TPA: DUF5703 domain-containing protein [Verrucomicrobiae bacterium]|jgi:hypothetical protein|nr:DUF5703 domain-containing protein [Verrucomicrobiae bacterium]
MALKTKNLSWRKTIVSFSSLVFLLELLIGSFDSRAGVLPSDVLSKLNSYNVVWTTTSTNGSAGSMPIGNGDITANVWVENNSGDLMMYIGKSDSWSEGTRLLKVGRVRTHFSPNPFASGLPFNQTLNFYNGEIDITAGQSGSQVNLRIYIDANQPVIRIEASGQQNFTMSCSNEIWRSSVQPLNSTNSNSFYGVASAPTTPVESADVPVTNLADRLVWYHQNNSSYFGTLFKAENMNGYAGSYADPWTNRIFGATILATNFSVVNSQQLQSGSGTNFLASIYPYTAQPATVANWEGQMSNLVTQVNATDIGTARTNHYIWWDAFWNRSWIFISGDANATNVTRGYLEQRFINACQSRGQSPAKFNGGSFTFDYNGQNGDYRAWGPDTWNQNTRELYWPLLASGDFDLMQPYFNIYTNMLPLQMAVTQKYYGHAGAFFPETFNMFGLYNGDNWGWNNSSGTHCGDNFITYHYQGGLDTLAMMLSYYDYTRDSSFATNYIVPFATQVIRFFNLHWSKVNGKLFFYPANACEMYWNCTNSTDYLSGLMSDITKLVALPANLTTPALINEWTNCYASLPPLPMDANNTYIKPAQTYGASHNSENPECYCIFPYRLYGLGLPNFNVALATFNNRTIKTYKYDWSQDVIEEPLVGLTAAAQTDVINNFKDTASGVRFQAFWATRNDYVPCEDTGGTAMSGLQYMLMQCVGSQIQLLPSWPTGWSVDFKLNAPSNTTVRLVLTNGAIAQLALVPASRINDLVEPVSPAPTGLTANGGNMQAALRWTGASGASGYNIKRATTNGGPYTIIATNVTGLSYINTGLLNGTNYYYVVSASGLWGEGSNSTEVVVTPGLNYWVHTEGDLMVNLQAVDLSSSTKVWTNRTSNPQSVGNFMTIGGGNLNMVTMSWNGQSVKTLFVNATGNNSVQSALASPVEINSNNPVSVEVWINAVSVSPKRAILNYGYQGGSGAQVEDREFSYDTGNSGVISGDFGNLDTAWATVPNTNAWHYLAYTWNGNTLTAYLDGNQDVQKNAGAICATMQTFMQVGSGIGGTGVNGGNDVADDYIAAARVESGVLTASDVAANYAMGPLGTAAAITPTGLAALAGDGQVTLTWSPSGNATNYNVKRSPTSNGTYTVVATNLTALSFTNTGLADGTTYYFVVSATNVAGESANSAPVSAQPASTTPPQLNFGVGSGQIQFSWPQDHLGWELQAQTNSLASGLGTNWVTLPGSESVTGTNITINPASGAVFYRLVYP